MEHAARPDLVHKAICAGQVQWKPKAAEIMRQNPDTRGFTTNWVKGILCEFVLAKGRGCIRARRETNEYWLEAEPDDPWWYKVNIELEDRPKRLFVKMRLVDPDDEDDPWVDIVGCHF